MRVRVATQLDEAVAPPAGDGSVAYAPLHDAFVYDTEVRAETENDAHARIVRMVEPGQRVLELGCATGSTTKVMQQMGCDVVAVEIDAGAAQIAEQFAERVIVGDLDTLDIDDALGTAYVAQADWDPRRGTGYVFIVLRPMRVQAWREVNEIAGRDVMLEGHWLA